MENITEAWLKMISDRQTDRLEVGDGSGLKGGSFTESTGTMTLTIVKIIDIPTG